MFREVNYEQPENRYFAETYDLGFSTMVGAATRGDATIPWENCKVLLGVIPSSLSGRGSATLERWMRRITGGVVVGVYYTLVYLAGVL